MHFDQLRQRDSNARMRESKSLALPLGYAAITTLFILQQLFLLRISNLAHRGSTDIIVSESDTFVSEGGAADETVYEAESFFTEG